MRLTIAADDTEIAQQKLEKLGCTYRGPFGGAPINLTAFGRGLIAACTPP